MNKNDFVVIKLVSGEQVMATLAEPPGRFDFVVKDVITIKHVPTMGMNGEVTERVLTTKFCNYTEDDVFVFDSAKIIYCKPLKKRLHSHYSQVVKDFNEEDPMHLEVEQQEDTTTLETEVKSILH